MAVAEAVTRMRMRRLSKRFALKEEGEGEGEEGERRRGCCSLKMGRREEDWRCENGEAVGEKAIERRKEEGVSEREEADEQVFCFLFLSIHNL